jgi:HD superfamily phosphohydrolase
MEFRGMETVVIDLLRMPEVQRLRRIKQLGLAHLVFPGAEHSRFAHSLGVAYVTIRFARHLQDVCRGMLSDLLSPSDSSIRDMATAALCHDLGHAPLSHAWEREVIGEAYDRGRWARALGLDTADPALKSLKWHELVTQALLFRREGQLHQLLEMHEKGFSERVRKLLLGDYYLSYLPGLLHGDIDADRADFLLRDTRQCGVTYGNYDLDWLISTCTVGKIRDDRLVVGFDRHKALRVVEHFLTSRRALYENVYYHKTVHCAEGMVSLFLRRLKRVISDYPNLQVDNFVRPLLRMIEGETVDANDLHRLDDYSLSFLIDSLSRTPGMDATIKELGRRIIERDLFKVVPVHPARTRDFLLRPDAFDRIFDSIRPYCAGDPKDYLIVDKYTFAMLSPRNPSYFVDDAMRASPIREHESLRLHWSEPEEFIRLFTVREAREAVVALMG